MNTNVVVSKGPTPPQDTSSLWLSTAKKHLRVPHAPAERRIFLRTTESWEGATSTEPFGFWNEALGLYCIYYNSAGKIGLATCENILGPLTKYGPLINPGARASHLIVGETIYIFYIGSPNTSVKLATAPLSDPTNITLVGTVLTSAAINNVEFGNVCPVVVGGVFRLYVEFAAPSWGWQMGVAECATVGGTYAFTSMALTSLQPAFGTGSIVGGTNGVSGAHVMHENGELTMFYHSSDTNEQGSKVFVATSPDTDGFNWTIQNNGYPIARTALVEEVDQIADPFVLELKDGGFELLCTIYDNATPAAYTVAMHLSPQFHEWDGQLWRPIMPSFDPFAQAALVHTQRRTAAYTAVHLDDVEMDPAATANMALTLPRAARGARVRVSHVGTGVGTILVGKHASDTLPVGATLAAGESATFECFVQTRWVKVA